MQKSRYDAHVHDKAKDIVRDVFQRTKPLHDLVPNIAGAEVEWSGRDYVVSVEAGGNPFVFPVPMHLDRICA